MSKGDERVGFQWNGCSPTLLCQLSKIGHRNSQLTVIKTTRFPSMSFHLSTKALTLATRSSSPAGGFCVWKYDSVLKGVDAMAVGANKLGLSGRGRGYSRWTNLAECYEKPALPYCVLKVDRERSDDPPIPR
jgi:hypothetical protein